MADDLGFGLAFKIMGVFALVGAAVVGTAIYEGTSAYTEHKDNQKALSSMTLRAEDTLRGKSLTVITMDKFKKTPDCGSDRPYGADFAAQDAGGKVVRGHICSSPDRESVVTLKP